MKKYSQDQLNFAHKIGRDFILNHGFMKREMELRFISKEVPEELARSVITMYEIEFLQKVIKKAKRLIWFGIFFMILGAGRLLYHWIKDEIFEAPEIFIIIRNLSIIVISLIAGIGFILIGRSDLIPAKKKLEELI